MRICILSTVVLKHMVMSYIYTEYFEANGILYDIIYPDKYHEEEYSSASNIYRFEININSNKLLKIKEFYKYKKYAEELMIKNKYDFIVIWNEMTAFLFADFLKKNYLKKYCMNVRDIYGNRKILINYQLKKTITNAAFTTITSMKYIEYLPNDVEYIMVHSINNKIMKNIKLNNEKTCNNLPINILYIGNIRFYEHAYMLIDALGNDDRYIMSFVGVNSEIIGNYAKNKKIYNVVNIGRFPLEKTGEYLQNADIIYNLYGDNDVNLRTALSNKLYYSIWLHIPILVYKNTYIYTVANECGIAYGIEKNDFSTNLADNLYSWYINLNTRSIAKKCEKYKREALQSHLMLIDILKKYITN